MVSLVAALSLAVFALPAAAQSAAFPRAGDLALRWAYVEVGGLATHGPDRLRLVLNERTARARPADSPIRGDSAPTR